MKLFIVFLTILIVKASENITTIEEDNGDANFVQEVQDSVLTSVKNVTDELQENFKILANKQSEFAQQVSLKLDKIENRLNSLEEKINESLSIDTSGISHLMHQRHGAELKDLRERHEVLANSVANIYHNVNNLAKMHNTSVRLEKTAELVLQERWSEASLHWIFVEKHTFDQDLLEEHLQTVILLVYGTHQNKSNLIPIFKFIHKLSFNDYKVYAYETLVNTMLHNQNNLFDGSEIIILAHYIRKNYGINSKGNSVLPPLASAVATGGNVKIIYLASSKTRKRRAGSKSSGRTYVPKKVDQGSLDFAEQGGLEIHVRGDLIKNKYDKPKSFDWPIYASKYPSYKPSYSAMWHFIYHDNGFFIVKNLVNEGYLNVPSNETQLLDTVSSLNKDKFNLEFKIILQSQKYIRIESTAFPQRPLVAVRQHEEEEVNAGSRDFSFRVGEWGEEGAKFSVLV